MQIQEKFRRCVVFILLTVILCGALAGCENKDMSAESGKQQIETLDDLAGKTIAVMTGSIYESKALEYLPDSFLEYYQTTPDCFLAVAEGKADALVVSSQFFESALEEYPNLMLVDKLCDADLYYGTTKSDFGLKIRKDLTEYLNREWENGGQQALLDRWKNGSRDAAPLDFNSLSGENGTIRCAVEPLDLPYTCQVNGGYAGIEAENLFNFCKEYGYKIDFQTLDWATILSGVVTGKLDLCMYTYYSKERAEKILYTVPYEKSQVVAVTGGLSVKPDGADGNEYGAHSAHTEQMPETETTALENHFDVLADKYAEKKIGVIPGTVFDRIADECFPKSSIEYINSSSDIALALETGRINAYIADEPTFRMIQKSYDEQYIEAELESISYGYIFPKGGDKSEHLREQLDLFLTKLRKNGTLSDLFDLWIGDDESKKIVDYSGITGENGELIMAVASSVGEPFCYLKDGQYAGYDVDIAVRFCREYGYGLKFKDGDFVDMINAVSEEECDFGASCITITEERKETLNFSDPNYNGGIVIVIRDTLFLEDTGSSEQTLWQSVQDSFRKTFLYEDRWKLFVTGIGVTLLITVISTVFGTAIAFLVFLLYRKKFRFPNTVINILSDFFLKMPVVVILMILYYIVFAKSNLDGVVVSCIGFSLIFSCSVLGCLKVAAGAVDDGQMEAAQALGYTDTRAFLRVILPQALQHFLPAYQEEIVTLIKGTAIVGYIAVQDLTKVSDIVRSRTYEAFFPLIASAVIYFAIAWILTLLVQRIRIRSNPKRRSSKTILRGVRTV